MKKQILSIAILCMLSLVIPGCAVVGGIFKAGMIWGILLALLVIFALIYLITRGGKK